MPHVKPSQIGIMQAPMEVDGDGTVWLSVERLTADEPEQKSIDDYLVSFDGSTTTHYPLVPDVNGLVVVGPEGAVRAATDDGLYIINPEAMAAIE